MCPESSNEPSDSFDDSGCCNQIQHCSLADVQAHILACVHGGKSNNVKPFEDLSVKEVKRELAARKLDSEGSSKEVRLRLAQRLEGIQRVPLLLVDNPHGDFEAPHLESYSLDDFEPLHAIKGHLINLFAELPHLPSPVQHETDQLLATYHYWS